MSEPDPEHVRERLANMVAKVLESEVTEPEFIFSESPVDPNVAVGHEVKPIYDYDPDALNTVLPTLVDPPFFITAWQVYGEATDLRLGVWVVGPWTEDTELDELEAALDQVWGADLVDMHPIPENTEYELPEGSVTL